MSCYSLIFARLSIVCPTHISQSTSSMKLLSLLAVFAVVTTCTNGQISTPPPRDANGKVIDPAFYTGWNSALDYPGCFNDLAASDLNGDGVIKDYEYLTFIQTYGKRICYTQDKLTLEQTAAFNSLACRCRNRDGYDSRTCCLGTNAQIETAGANNPKRTPEQKAYLTAVCRVTDGTMYEPRGCPPRLINPNIPPGWTFANPAPIIPIAGPANGTPFTNGELAGIIVAALLAALLCCFCCCCCVWKKRRAVADEEEEEEKITETVEEAHAIGEPTEMVAEKSAPAIVPPIPIVPPADEDDEDVRGGAGGADFEDDEEAVRRRGGAGNIPEEEDEEELRRRGGTGNIDEYEDVEEVRRRGGTGKYEDDEEVRRRGGFGTIDEYEEDEEVRRRGGTGHVDEYEDDEDIRRARGAAGIDEYEDDEETRRKMGSGKFDDEPEKKKWTAEGEIPPPSGEPERVLLRPVEDEEEEDPDWDHAGRNIDYPKDKDPDEGQILDPYTPDGGVYNPERGPQDRVAWRTPWQQEEEEDPDEFDNRKHRIQAGLGEGEVWKKLDEEESADKSNLGTGGDVFDWVVQSALGVLKAHDDQTTLDDKSTP
jgi:hypothetical protein